MAPDGGGQTDGGGSFWKTLPGILTASAGLVASLSGLLVGLGQAGLIGPKAKAVAEEPRKPDPVQPAKPEPPMPIAAGETEYRVGQMSDGFAWIRAQPTVSSAGLVKLPSGTHILCGGPVGDATGADKIWRPCRDNDGNRGFISARLLLRVG